jgi:hypothetical protein
MNIAERDGKPQNPWPGGITHAWHRVAADVILEISRGAMENHKIHGPVE